LAFPDSTCHSSSAWRSSVRTRRMVGTGFSCLKRNPTGRCNQRVISTALTPRSTKEDLRESWSDCATSSINPSGQPPSQKCLPAIARSGGSCPTCVGMRAVNRCLRHRYSTISLSSPLWWREKESFSRGASPQSGRGRRPQRPKTIPRPPPARGGGSLQLGAGENPDGKAASRLICSPVMGWGNFRNWAWRR